MDFRRSQVTLVLNGRESIKMTARIECPNCHEEGIVIVGQIINEQYEEDGEPFTIGSVIQCIHCDHEWLIYDDEFD